MPDTYAAEPRTTLGKSVAALRRKGTLPANIYGRGVDSTAVQIATRDAQSLLKAHGINGLVNLQVAGEATPRTVVVRSTQRHPVNQQLQHLDFLQVDLNRKMQAHIPVVVTGEAPAVHVYQGILLTGADSIQVEALPADIPESIEVSIESLRRPESVITVGSLKLPASVRVLTDPDTMIARIGRTRLRPEAEADILEGEEPEAAEEGADASSDEPAD